MNRADIRLLHSKAQLAQTLLGNLVPISLANLESPEKVCCTASCHQQASHIMTLP